MNDSTNSTHVPQHRLRRLAQRSLRVLDRHAPKHEVLASIDGPFRAIAVPYITAYDEVVTSGPDKALEVQQGRGAVKTLFVTQRSWLGWLARDVEGFDASVFSKDVSVPDDVIADGERMIDLVARYQEKSGARLSYGDKLIEDVSRALEAARKEWMEAQDKMVALQERQAQVRRLAAELQQNLVALRRTLRNVLGRSHKDYQKLRLAKTTHLDDEDPEVTGGDAQPGDPTPSPTEDASTNEPTDDQAAAE